MEVTSKQDREEMGDGRGMGEEEESKNMLHTKLNVE